MKGSILNQACLLTFKVTQVWNMFIVKAKFFMSRLHYYSLYCRMHSLQHHGLSRGLFYRCKWSLTPFPSGLGKLQLDCCSSDCQGVNTYSPCRDWELMGFNLTLPSGLFVVLINPRSLLFQTHLIPLFPHDRVSALINLFDFGCPEITQARLPLWFGFNNNRVD